MIPYKIYLEKEFYDNGTLPNGVNWAQRSGGGDIEYIRKDALMEWAKEKNEKVDADEGDYSLGYMTAIIGIIDKIEAM